MGYVILKFDLSSWETSPVMKNCYLELKGGLGNQLFQVQAGVYYAAVNNLKLKVKLKESTNRHKNSSISSFSSNSLMINPPKNIRETLNDRVLQKTIKKLTTRISALEINESIPEIASHPSRMTHIKHNGNIILNGYFQSAQIFSLSRSLGFSLNPILVNESIWFKDMSKKIKDENPILMHVRRGDYAASSQWGMLGMKYYQDAIDYFGPSNKRKIYMFTDDLPVVHKEVENSKLHNRVEIISPPQGTTAAEILLLISKATNIVTANSTFSIWSALLATNAYVIVPSQFYRRADTNSERYLPNWHLVSSDWISG